MWLDRRPVCSIVQIKKHIDMTTSGRTLYHTNACGPFTTLKYEKKWKKKKKNQMCNKGRYSYEDGKQNYLL